MAPEVSGSLRALCTRRRKEEEEEIWWALGLMQYKTNA